MSWLRKLFPKYGDDLATEGAGDFNNGRTTQAIEKLTRALQLEFRHHARDKILTILGNAYQVIEQYEKAIETHQEALQVNPQNHQVWVNLGIAHRKHGKIAKAGECYKKAIEIDPDYAEVHASLGALYIFMGEGKQAIDTLNHAKKLDPSVAVTHGNLALAMVGRFEEAEATLKQAVTLGYRNDKSVRERIGYLRELEAANQEEPYGPGEYHLVCPQCGTKVVQELAADPTGGIIKCEACGGPMTRFSAS